ncbi:MAG TPA: hypothetical protein VMV93_08380 [Chloroflexota bacterium]|nr:hypothetical protein [Chloroflexota bacterium]
MGPAFLILASFLACSVEMVEALTIILAVGVTRGWRAALVGMTCGIVALAVIVGALGPALLLVPINALRVVVGTILLIFGLQWLRKAILRAGGHKALHDEAAIYQRELAEAQAAGREVRIGLDWYGFTLSFKGVLLEGLEVAFIVLTFGSTAAADGRGSIQLAALGAAGAVVWVTAVGVAVHKPLSRVPENWMKFAVGAMLTTFGTFWGGEGIGVIWPGSDGAILAILGFVLFAALVMVTVLRKQREQRPGPALVHAA